MNKIVLIGIIIAVVGLGLASPLFYESEIDEELPIMLNNIEEGLTLEKFVSMEDQSQQEITAKMPEKLKEMIMDEMAKNETLVSEDISTSEIMILKSGEFEGLVGHDAKGTAKIIQLDGLTYLSFEDFQVTNGPDLRVYLTDNGDVKNGIQLEKLKGSKGNQNYLLEDLDFEKYNIVVIYCQPFGVHFGQAHLG